MKQLKPIIVVVLVAFAALELRGQISVQYLHGHKTTYHLGDTVRLCVRVVAPPETCLDGMNSTKLYQRGIAIIQQSDWQEIGKGIWQKEASLTITGNRKSNATLTILRRNDRQTASHQEFFPYATHDE
jgi:hypothetical protein